MLYQFWIHLININLCLTSFTPSKLPGEIHELCPYSDICNKTAERTLDDDSLVPCCFSCGCDEDCGLRLDCCFEHLDKYKLVEHGKVSCISATTRKENVMLTEIESNDYYMVQTCDNEVIDAGEHNELSHECRLTDDLGNSLIAPVSSKENNLIYINKNCAACNMKLLATPIKQWNYLFIPEIELYETTVSFDIQQHVENKVGVIRYIPPEEEDWSHQRCFTKYASVDSCERSNVWYNLCEQLHAPFQALSTIVYKSVFCALCNGEGNNYIRTECESTESKWQASKALTFLLNSAVIEASKLMHMVTVTNKAKPENACQAGYIEHLHSTCLAIHCPGGMLKTGDGCTYFALRWYTDVMVMYVKLLPKPGTQLKISQLQSLGNRERKNPFTWLRLPCRKLRITSIEVFYSNASLDSNQPPILGNDTKTYVLSFIVRMWKTVDIKSGIDPALSIPMFHKCVRESWEATIGKETFKLDAHFDKYLWYAQEGKQKIGKWPNIDPPYDGIARPVQYTALTKGPLSRDYNDLNVVVLKRPFFCKQVRIPAYDIEINFGEIRIISRNISLGTNEYQVNAPFEETDWNKTTYSICIDDYNPNLMSNYKNSKHEMSPTLTFIIVSFLVKCILNT